MRVRLAQSRACSVSRVAHQVSWTAITWAGRSSGPDLCATPLFYCCMHNCFTLSAGEVTVCIVLHRCWSRVAECLLSVKLKKCSYVPKEFPVTCLSHWESPIDASPVFLLLRLRRNNGLLPFIPCSRCLNKKLLYGRQLGNGYLHVFLLPSTGTAP